MATPTTAWSNVRNQMVETIEALTPAAISPETFRVSRTQMFDFRAYAEESDASAFREFDIIVGDTQLLAAEDHTAQLRETAAEIVVAYPHHGALYATGGLQAQTDRFHNRSAMTFVMESDANAIMKAVGRRGGTNYLNGQLTAIETGWLVEDADGVSFCVIPFTTQYYYNAS